MQPQQPGQPPYGQQPPMGGPPAGGAPGPAGPPNPAQTAAIILAVCGVLMAVGVFTKSWLSASEGKSEVGVGLLGAQECRRGECRSFSWGDMKGAVPGDVKAVGYLGFVAGLGAIGAAGFCAFLAFQRQSHKIPVKVIQGVFGAAAFSFTYFLVRLMLDDKLGKGLGPSFSGIVAIVGVVGAGFVLKQMLMPIIKQGAGAAAPASAAAMPMGGAPQAPAMAPVACPRCNGQAAYVAQYQRHFCNACQQYV